MSRPNSDVRVRIFFALQRAGIHMSIPAESVFSDNEGEKRARSEKAELELQRRLSALKNALNL